MSSHEEHRKFYENNKYLPKEKFAKKYKRVYCRKEKAEALYILILNELKKAVLEGSVDNIATLNNIIDHISDIEDQVVVSNYYESDSNPIKGTNLVILACKHRKHKILKYLIADHNNILNNLSVSLGRAAILPADEDEECHNAFYYAIRSSKIKLLDTLITRWPNNYFDNNLEVLNDIISNAYEELKLKNVFLLDEMEVFVQEKSVDWRFFSTSSRQDKTEKSKLDEIKERIELVLQNISSLIADHAHIEEVDGKMVFIVKCISQNIHILKRQLKCAYRRIPWEEMEFCLIIFALIYSKPKEINLFYSATLNKFNILNYLQIFAIKLEEEKVILDANFSELEILPKLAREKIVEEIICNCPQFEDLYNTYQRIRDIRSLEKISDCVELAISADPTDYEGRLIIIRALQIIGEYFKNTLESPKLSSTTSNFLLLLMSESTKKTFTDLRNSLSHVHSLSQRLEIEKNKSADFFTGIQNETEKIGCAIVDILFRNKIKTIRTLFKKISKTENLYEISKIVRMLDNVKLELIIPKNFDNNELERIRKLISELNNVVTEKTYYENEMFKKLDEIINSRKTKLKNTGIDYAVGLAMLSSLGNIISYFTMDQSNIRQLKYLVHEVLETISPQIDFDNIKNINVLLKTISHSAGSRMQQDTFKQVALILYKVFYITEFQMNEVRHIDKFKDRLSTKDFNITAHSKVDTHKATVQNYNNQLTSQLSKLKRILDDNTFCDLTKMVLCIKNNRKQKTAVDMLLLDIFSILSGCKDYLENNQLFLDESLPLLIGKSLRNYLAHDNDIIDTFYYDPLPAVILSAYKLTKVDVLSSKNKIGRLVKDDIRKLRNKYDRHLDIIANQEKMFLALEEGNLNDFRNCIKKGADIRARNRNLWTTLHFAAKGSNLEAVKFICMENLSATAKDTNGQSPLHIAAAYGRNDVVKYFVEEADVWVDVLDNNSKTPLHLAAQNGHKDAVEILLKLKASISVYCRHHILPAQYAIRKDHFEVAKLLLEHSADDELNESIMGYTPLHEAAERGNLDLVNFLLQRKIDVNDVKNGRRCAPLHLAAFNGHLEVSNILISSGGDVNSRNIVGLTPLYEAVENNHKNIAKLLLRNGANVDAADKVYNATALHIAAKYGHTECVKLLLKNRASVYIATAEGQTPLHLAVQNGFLEISRILLKYGADINAKSKDNSTVLHYAAECGNIDILEILIKYNAKVNTQDNILQTPLHVACQNGYVEIIKILIKNKAKINTKDFVSSTPLHAGTKKGNYEVVDLLIENKADVNARDRNRVTPLHEAAKNSNKEIIDIMIKNDADVNAKDIYGRTPLHAAAMAGYAEIAIFLLNNKAEIDAVDIFNKTPLHTAIEAGHVEVVEILIENKADITTESNNSPLISAIKHRKRKIVEILIANGVNVNSNNGEALFNATLAGCKVIVNILLRNKADVNVKDNENVTLLHLAACLGYMEIVNSLIKKGLNVDAMAFSNVRPLHCAAESGHEEVVEFLISKGANVNITNEESSPLHAAAANDHHSVVQILVDNKANVIAKDNKNRSALELAVGNCHMRVIEILCQHAEIDINAKGDNDWTLLHIASQTGNLEITKYLVDKGSNINARSNVGSKPIHIAAREGHINIVKFFLDKGLNINDLGIANQTLLHYATLKGQTKVSEYLIEQGIDINGKDNNGLTSIHIAASLGENNLLKILLQNGAIYNTHDFYNRKPLNLAKNDDVILMLDLIRNLFDAVKHNNSSNVTKYIREGVVVNAKNASNATPLHVAAWKGHDRIVDILLQNQGNPNAVDHKGFSPLHYAVKFSCIKVVKALLCKGAIYNAESYNGKMPVDFAEHTSIAEFFKLLTKSFKCIESNSFEVIEVLNRAKDIETIKIIMNACNEGGQSLIIAAMHSNFSYVEELKQILQENGSTKIGTALSLIHREDFQNSLTIFESLYEERKNILGSDNPGTLDIRKYIATVLYKRGDYQKALGMLKDILQKQSENLGWDCKDTISTRSLIALILHRQGKNEEAYNIYKEVYQKQKENLGSNHSDTLETQMHLGLVLNTLKKCEDALNIFKELYEKYSLTNQVKAAIAQNNIALVLSQQAKYEEALKMYGKALIKKRILLGPRHSDTLRTLDNIATVFSIQKRYQKALKTYQDVLTIRRDIFGTDHPETLITQYNIARVLFTQSKLISALTILKNSLDKRKAIFGTNHISVLGSLAMIEAIKVGLNYLNFDITDITQYIQRDINLAASNGDLKTLALMIKNGADINDKDNDGRTALHYCVSSGNIAVVKFLLTCKADVTQVTNNGNTPLHIAASKGYKEIVEVLLCNVSRNKLHDFINAITTTQKTTSLHIAAKNGFLEVVISLLKYGAVYNIKNREDKTPLDLSKNKNIVNLLELLDVIFDCAKNGSSEVIEKLLTAVSNEFEALVNARNDKGHTILQVAIANKNQDFVSKLLEIINTQ